MIYDLPPILFLISFGAFSVMAVCYLILLRAYFKLKEKEQVLRTAESTHRKAERILEHAQEREEEIIKEGYEKAAEVMEQAEVFDQDAQEKLAKVVEGMALRASEELKTQTGEEIKEFKKEMIEQTNQNKQELSRVMAQQLVEAEEEVKRYKEEKMKEAEIKVAQMVKEVTAKVLNEGLDPDQHQDLIIRSLEDAKRKRVF